ncbi:MAG: DUF2339 domain-containing protein [Campylobacterales bacterium]
MLEGLFFIIIIFLIMDLYKKNRVLRDQVDALSGRKPVPHDSSEEKTEEPAAAEPMVEPEAEPVTPPAQPHRQVQPERRYVQAVSEESAPQARASEPAKESALAEAVRRFITGGNLLVKIGGIVFFLGLVFLVKYAAEHNMISIEVRLIVIALGALVLTGIGWRLREREGYYGLVLQSLGIASFYLVVFASAKLYGLLTMPQAFVIMLIVVVFGSLLAVAQDAVVLAVFSAAGGFLVPILTSDESGSHIILFSYYALLNIGILLIAWYRSWRILNIVGFFSTFVIATAWGVLRYEPALFASTEPFLIFFFLLYLGVSILFTSKQPFKIRTFIDSTLVFGLPLIAFSLQATMVDRFEYGVFFSAVAVGTVYLVLFRWLSRYEKMQMLSEAFRAIAVVFYTVAIPYALDDDITGALWALEASAIVWISLKYKKSYGVLFGIALELAAIVLYVLSTVARETEGAFLNGIFLGYVIVVVAAGFTSYRFWVHRTAEKDSMLNTLSVLFLGAGFLMWLLAGVLEAERMAMPQGNVLLIYTALSAVLFAAAAVRYKWSALEKVLQFYLPLGLVFFGGLLHHYTQTHPFEGIGSISAGLFFVVHYGLLVRFESGWKLRMFLHAAAMLTVVLILSRELQYAASLLSDIGALHYCAFGALPALMLVVITKAERYFPSFISRNIEAYRLPGGVGLSAVIGLWELNGIARDGAMPFMPYIPLLSPLDLFQALGAAAFVLWLRHINRTVAPLAERIAAKAAGVLAFLYATVLLGRTVHFYGGVDYTMTALGASLLFQASLSILWSLMGIAAMLVGKRTGERPVWVAGAGVLALVVFKLFMVDLSGSGTVERIVSFISVGALLLLVGYFAPIPPSKPKRTEAETTG